MQVSVHEAKTHLSRLLKRAEDGEEVIIARGSEPVARLVPVKSSPLKRRLGGVPGLVTSMADDFDEELEDFAEYGR
jgi:prevent-host-death family protein